MQLYLPNCTTLLGVKLRDYSAIAYKPWDVK